MEKSEININSLSVGWHFTLDIFLFLAQSSFFLFEFAFKNEVVLLCDVVIIEKFK